VSDYLIWVLGSVITSPKEVSQVLSAMSLVPATISLFNFVLLASLLLGVKHLAPNSPSPLIAFFDVFLSIISLLGSLASIWSVFA